MQVCAYSVACTWVRLLYLIIITQLKKMQQLKDVWHLSCKYVQRKSTVFRFWSQKYRNYRNTDAKVQASFMTLCKSYSLTFWSKKLWSENLLKTHFSGRGPGDWKRAALDKDCLPSFPSRGANNMRGNQKTSHIPFLANLVSPIAICAASCWSCFSMKINGE